MSVNGKKVLVVVTNYGAEQDEVTQPVKALRDAGAAVTVAAQKREPITTLVHDSDPGKRIDADAAFGGCSASDFDAVVVPGGTVNADNIRIDTDAQRLLSEIAGAGKVVAAVCHGPWLLIESGLASGRDLTSYHTLQTDLINAGAKWQDNEVVVDASGGFTLITSRNPGDLDAFSGAIIKALDT